MTDEPALHSDSEMSLLFAFEDQSASYVHGFEAGQVSARIQSGEQEIDLGYESGFPAHTANIGTFKRMAQAYGYRLETKQTDHEEWTAVRFTIGAPKPALKLVK